MNVINFIYNLYYCNENHLTITILTQKQKCVINIPMKAILVIEVTLKKI